MRIIPVHNADVALPEQQSLALHVFLKVHVLIRPDVIRRYIGEYSDIEDKPLGTVQLQRLR